MNQHASVSWPGAALVARLPQMQRNAGTRPRRQQGKNTMTRVARLVQLKQFLQARLNEVARVLRTPPPCLQLDHLGNASIDARPVALDLTQIETLRHRSPETKICPITLLRASLAALFEPLLQADGVRRLIPAAVGGLARATDFLAGYVLAAFRATFETRSAFLREVAPLPDDQNPAYLERLSAFEQGQLAFRPAT